MINKILLISILLFTYSYADEKNTPKAKKEISELKTTNLTDYNKAFQDLNAKLLKFEKDNQLLLEKYNNLKKKISKILPDELIQYKLSQLEIKSKEVTELESKIIKISDRYDDKIKNINTNNLQQLDSYKTLVNSNNTMYNNFLVYITVIIALFAGGNYLD